MILGTGIPHRVWIVPGVRMRIGGPRPTRHVCMGRSIWTSTIWSRHLVNLVIVLRWTAMVVVVVRRIVVVMMRMRVGSPSWGWPTHRSMVVGISVGRMV